MEQIDFNRALILAEEIHLGQVRTGTNKPYITHPMAVAQLLIEYGRPKNEVIAGLLHDTVEDTTGDKLALRKRIEDKFGLEVERLVFYVTKISCREDGNRSTRVKIDIYHYVSGPEGSHNIKLADVMHNLSDADTLDPQFAKKYVKEKHMLLLALEAVNKADKQMLIDTRILIDKLLLRFNK